MEKKKILSLVSLGLFVVSLVLLLVTPVLTSSTAGADPIPHLGVVFGAEGKFSFSILNFLTLIVLLAVLVLAVLRVMDKSLLSAKTDSFVLLGLAVVAVVLVALTKTFIIYDNAVVEAVVTSAGYGLSVSAIIAMVLTVIGGGVAVASEVLV